MVSIGFEQGFEQGSSNLDSNLGRKEVRKAKDEVLSGMCLGYKLGWLRNYHIFTVYLE